MGNFFPRRTNGIPDKRVDQSPQKNTGKKLARAHGDINCDSASTVSLGRAGHAGFAYINTLAEVFCIEFLVPLGDASTLLIRVFSFLRTRRDVDGYCDQNNETWASARRGPRYSRTMISLTPVEITKAIRALHRMALIGTAGRTVPSPHSQHRRSGRVPGN
jgi:hypothetical protein